MTIALLGVVILVSQHKGSKNYPGLLIFVMAAYSFYKIIIAIINLFRIKKMNSILLMVARNISFAEALMSIFCLQLAMFVSFDTKNNGTAEIMNMITGIAVCLIIAGIGVFMFHMGKRK